MGKQIEDGRYSAEFKSIGYSPEGRLRYTIGHSNKCLKEPLRNSNAKIDEAFSSFACVDPTFENKFETFAVADFGEAELDIWKIDQGKNLVNLSNGRGKLRPEDIFWF